MMDGLTPEMPQRVAPQQIHESSGLPHGHVPVYLPGSSSLVEELDKQVLVILRDGRHLVGVSSCICFPFVLGCFMEDPAHSERGDSTSTV